MEQDKEATRRGWLYYWANEEKTLKAIPPSEMIEDHEDDDRVPCEVYSRIVGYMRPVKQWNEGKKQEWEDRKAYVLPEVIE